MPAQPTLPQHTKATPLVSQIHPEHTLDHAAHACNQYNKLVGEEDTLEVLKLKWGILAPKQKGLSAAIEDKALKDIIEIAEPLKAARLRALQQPGTSTWLTSTPDPQMGHWMTPKAFKAYLCYCYGQPIGIHSATCLVCNAPMDPQGHHALKCKTSSNRVRRHNVLTNKFFTYAQKALLNPGMA